MTIPSIHKYAFPVDNRCWLMIIFIAINALFMTKYSMRVTAMWPAIVIVYTVFMYFVFMKVIPLMDTSLGGVLNIIKITALSCILIMLAAQLCVDPMSVNVDRWSALHNPISYLLDGRYPYSAPTHLGGRASPFPVWQVLHIPFYVCGNVGLSFFAAVALFLWSIRRVFSSAAAWKAIVLIATSITFYYEAAVRSDIVANLLLLASSIILIRPYLSQQWAERYYIPISIVIGLFASTRLITLLPIIILLFPYYIRLKPYKMVLIPMIIAIAFVMTFVPIILLNPHEFLYGQYPPWLLQTRQGSAADFLIFIPVVICFSLIWHGSFGRYCLLASVYLIVFVAVTFLHNMIQSDNFNLFHVRYDITYFSTALPFTIAGISIWKKPEDVAKI